MLKIVAVFPPPTTGMTHVTKAIAERLSETIDVRRFVVSKTDGKARFWSFRKHLALLRQLTRAIFSDPQKAPVYIVLDAGQGAWGSLVLVLLAKLNGVPLIIHHHVFSYVEASTLATRSVFAVAPAETLHITLCPCMADKLKRLYGDSVRTSVLSNAAFIAPSEAQRSPARALNSVGFLGNITREKGILLFLETMRVLEDRDITLSAIIAGPISDVEIRSEVDAFIAEAPERRSYRGPVYGEDKAAFYQDIDALLFPSQYRNEAQPVTIYEALAVGCPVLATDRGCIPDQLPSEWVFDQECFVASAGDLLEIWAKRDGEFEQAANLGCSVWVEAQAMAQKELQALSEQMLR
ncbi:glycosyltransferase family 4 protein [Marinicauda sp. Alg238-R41]|uniref:glycosyltransferase family 4 protein n=1 Tax=Marinicauda sp. Alg238-R41 TaxID=2993447 RepID=UPI0022E71645|nr:glycosyltransferase family 4 protein [Marinicauda sp. Alg238-R41]